MKLAILSTHLTGTGHLVRMAALARAGTARGHEVLLMTGGRPLDHPDLSDLTVVQLPPVMVGADLDYATLRAPDGAPADAARLAARIARATQALGAFAPDVLVTETWPLGRRNLAGEYRAATAAARAAGAVCVASARDIPEPKPHRLAEAEAELDANFAALLVHGDPEFIPLSASWPFTRFADRIIHTGYVAAQPVAGEPVAGEPVAGQPAAGQPVAGGALVSGGGGLHGRGLFRIAARAARRSPLPWRILVGGADGFSPLPASTPAPPNLTVEPVRPDYRALLARAGVFIGLCGYNAALDLAACQTPAILVPMREGGEREQSLRARRLAGFEGIAVLEPDGLTAETLASFAERMAGRRRPKIPLGVDGAARSIEILEGIIKGIPGGS